MGKFGKKVEVSLNPLDYNICLLGESKIGKTTICKEICEKLVGENGYIHFDIGKEEGRFALQNLVSEPIEDWAKLKEVVTDIIDNKDEDYPELKTIIWDTLDELILIAEAESLREWNKKNPEKKADSVSAAWGGFMRGQDHAMELILNTIWELKKVGVSSIIVSHIKRTDITDPVSQDTYSKITADTQQRYFNAIKNKMHFVAVAYIDREIVKEKTGKKNPVTRKEETINKLVSESRVITFRDDTYSCDSGSRFADIVDRIPFDSDAFIKAMEDAIKAEQAKSGVPYKEAEKKQKALDKEKAKATSEYSKNAKENKIDVEKNEELVADIKEKFSNLSEEGTTEIKEYMKELGIKNFKTPEEIPTKHLEQIVEKIDSLTEE